MNLIWRLIRVMMVALFGRRIGFMDTSVVRFRVLPNDLDTNLHMNNGRYLTVMDLGRVDLVIRTEFYKVMIARGWFPVLASAMVRFRRPLHLFESYELKTRTLCFDDKWVYLEQRMEAKGHLYAHAVHKTVFRKKGGGSVPTRELVAAAGHSGPWPEVPVFVTDWQRLEGEMGQLPNPPSSV